MVARIGRRCAPLTRAARRARDSKRGVSSSPVGPRTQADIRQCGPGRKCISVEDHCGYTERHLERYNPVKTHDGRHGRTYAQYKALADAEAKLTFIGGIYQHLDMHQVINQSLRGAHVWMDAA
jgi:hypothetical protein